MIHDNNQSLMSAHKVLELLMTRAAVSGKLQNAAIRIPHKDLKNSIGNSEFDSKVDLLVKLEFNWVEALKLEDNVSMEGEND